ncbi:FHA domain-containing protein [Nocardioides sp. JQ2195]|uniref:FHA domain-containing protein n=1 Tax=Nocardioides sp. JQ2195 TaxID=2592334 RepID=UPI00143EF2E9|nr:FHA domain-containing protein [Nocardioides sp. JQ2195]QIX25772.1 FHA domain-containing protein [Nocardioides sp. JQ2195]
MGNMAHQPAMLSTLRVAVGAETRMFTDPVVTVGRDGQAPISLQHPDVSRRHAEFRRTRQGWVLVDLDSTNGTWLGEQQLGQALLPVGRPVHVLLGGSEGVRMQVEVVPAQVTSGPPGPASSPSAHPGHSTGPASHPAAEPRPAPYAGPRSDPGAHPDARPGHGWSAGPAQPAPSQPDSFQPAPFQPAPFQPAPPSRDVPIAPGAMTQPWYPAGESPMPQPPPGHLAHGHTVLPGNQLHGRLLTIGRSRTCDVVIDDPLVSRQHATLVPGPAPVLNDLGSFNGTFVNGTRLNGSIALHPGDEVIFGNQTFSWTGTDLASRATRTDLTLFAENLTTVAKGGKRLLEGMSFELGPSSLTAVIGPSGAGKSTLLGALTGSSPATHGQVIWQGQDLYSHYEQLRFQIGLVPQSDIQHPQLSVRQGLSYASMLRLPPDTTVEERSQRVQHVVSQMQLERQIDNRIGTQLSGGQRKRVSIATELLTAPPLLFLDEPTSGLDPGLDRDVMHQLRTLADEGRVVMVVTHSVLALDVCDNVLVLAPGGRRAYFGPPGGVLEHFGCRDYPQVFDLLDEPDLWQRIPAPPAPVDTGRLPSMNAPVTQPPLQSMSRQFWTLVRRNLAVTVSDKLLLAMLVLLPLALGGLSRVVPGEAGLGIARTAGPGEPMDHKEALTRLTILIMAAALMGTAVTIRELVGERPIFQREYAVGLSPGMYLLSKVTVLGTACFLQGMVVTWLATVGLPGPDSDGALGLGTFEVALAIGGLCFVMALLGLAVSALVTSNEQTMPALVGLVMVQLVLCGALVPVAGRVVLEQLAWLSPARWAFAASSATVDLDKAKHALPKAKQDDLDSLYDQSAGQWVLNMSMMWILAAVILATAFWLVRRSATSRR